MPSLVKEINDQKLLQAWSGDRCERSFRCLVEHYADLVFGTALRRTRNRVLAEEAAQNVFTALAHKGVALDGTGGLGGWLFRAALLEAAALVRRETRRERRMGELTELEEALRRGGGEPMTGEALELVDDSLAELPERDRDVLLARFFEGCSFSELAERSGRKEAAVRKQVSRALQKLNDLLAGHGLRVSTSVLVAGLGVMMATKAPAGMAGNLASGAMAGASGVTAPGILTTIAMAMTTSKLTTILIVGGVLFLVTSGASYLAGRGNALRAQDGRAAMIDTPTSGGPSSRGSARSKPAERERNLSSVQEIVRRLREELRGKDWATALQVGRSLVDNLDASEAEEVLSLVRKSGNSDLNRTILAVLYYHWGTLEGHDAVAAAIAEDDDILQRVGLEQSVQAWASVNAQAALRWHTELSAETDLPVDESAMGRLEGTILQGWARSDMKAAWDYYETLGADGQRATLGQLEDLITEEDLREAMGTRIAQIKNERVRSRVAEEVGETWARFDPKGAVTWFDTLEFDDGILRFRAAMEIGEGWFETDPMAAVTWLWPKIPEGMQGHFAGELAESPFGEDEAEMATFLAERGYNPDGSPKK